MYDDPMRWEPEYDEEGGTVNFPWCPTLWGEASALSLPVWFQTEEACREFIATIPAGVTVHDPARP